MTRPALLILALTLALGSAHRATVPQAVLEGWIEPDTYGKLLPMQRQILSSVLEAGKRGEEVPMACWAPGTDLDIVTAFSAASRAPGTVV